MNIVLWLKSWHLAEKPGFPHKHYKGGICTHHPQEIEENLTNLFKAALEF
jgi:hypothetical protein